MQGLDRIIAARGGVDQLGFDGLLRMQITWYTLSHQLLEFKLMSIGHITSE